MKCAICRVGETQPSVSTVTLERDSMTLVVKGVPAEVCTNCGEAYFSAEITEQLLTIADEAEQAGIQVDVRHYVAA